LKIGLFLRRRPKPNEVATPPLLGVSFDLPDVPIGGAGAAAMPAADAFDDVDDTLIHTAASPE